MTAPENDGERVRHRLDSIGISKSEFAERAGVDRSTVDRALDNDPKVRARTWGKINKALTALEDELGMAASGQTVTSTVEIGGAKITVAGSPEDVAAAVRKILAEHDND